MPSPIISPSLLSCDFANMESELDALKEVEGIWIHLDIMDGHFVPNLTFGLPVVKRISTLTKHPLDAHLMVTNPRFHIDQMKDFGLRNITFHHEALPPEQVLPLLLHAKNFYPGVGISIKPETPVSALSDDILQSCDLVLVMSVAPGHGGQRFLPGSLEKIAQLKQRRQQTTLKWTIQVDGGINEQSAQQALTSGADNLVAGSYVFGGPRQTYGEKIQCLQNL